MTSTATWTVTGMTCGHCVAAVRSEVAKLAGVETVDVDLDSGEVTVTSDRRLPADEIAGAVDEAGYEVATT